MLGWIKRSRTSPARSPEDIEAYELGRRAAGQMADALDGYMRKRFDPVADRYLDVLRGQIQKCFQSNDGPPISLGRIEYSIFLENVRTCATDMAEEIDLAMHDWRTVADRYGTRDSFDKLIAKRISDFETNLTLVGLEVLLKYADGLKEADVLWRKANPEKALDWPESGEPVA